MRPVIIPIIEMPLLGFFLIRMKHNIANTITDQLLNLVSRPTRYVHICTSVLAKIIQMLMRATGVPTVTVNCA